MRILLCVLMIGSCLYALGEKPRAQVSGKGDSRVTAANPQAMTADGLFADVLQKYIALKKANYEKSRQDAELAIANFLTQYPQDNRVSQVTFYAERVQALKGDSAAQTKYLDKYFTLASPTNNALYYLARLDKATLEADKGNSALAITEYETVYAAATENAEVRDEALLCLIPQYEQQQKTEKLKVLYTFFIEHKDKLPTSDLYYIYAYKLGVIYYNQGDKKQAQKYFAIVKTGDLPVLKMFKESIAAKYK